MASRTPATERFNLCRDRDISVLSNGVLLAAVAQLGAQPADGEKQDQQYQAGHQAQVRYHPLGRHGDQVGVRAHQFVSGLSAVQKIEQ